MHAIWVLAAAGAVIFALRSVFIVGAGHIHLPPSWQAALEHARPAVLGALLVSLVAGDGPAELDPRALVVAAVALIASRFLGMVGTVLAGAVAVLALAAL